MPITRYHEVVPEARVRVDVKYQSGPVVALREGFELLKAEWVLVLPCDAPAISEDDVRLLLDEARAEKGPAVAVAGKDVLYDLFCAPRSALHDGLQTAKRLEDLVENARRVPIPERVGLNLNEPPGASP